MKEYVPQRLSRAALLEKAKSLPTLPGIYLHYDKNGEIIYVGKSRSLKNRVLSYFSPSSNHTAKTYRLVQNIADFTTIVTASESEALILENEKIKLHKPKYNIRLKDDKDYPYIRLSLGEAYPKLSFARRKDKKNHKDKFFGPYGSSGAVRSAIDTANKLFLLPTCKLQFPRDIGKTRPCLYHHIGKCIGVCTGSVSEEEYRKRIDDVILFFKNDHKKLISRLTREMEEESAALRFEKAGEIRDKIAGLKALLVSDQVVRDLHFEADVFGFYCDDLGGAVNLLSIREGRVADSTVYHFGADEILTQETFTSFLLSVYGERDEIPKEVLLPSELYGEETPVLAELLSDERERKVLIRVPERGDGRALLSMANENAKAATLHRRAQFEKDEKVLLSLADLLSLEVLPERIESIDISNSGSDVITAGVITLEKGRFLKKAYKSFTIEKEKPDDPSCMYEAIYRRMKRYVEGDPNFSPLPDLILVDGAEAQVKAVKAALEEWNLFVPVFGMVKDAFHKTRNLTNGEEDISIANDQRIFQFIYRIQEEVHRYSLSRMDVRRRKSVKKSVLTEIRGIGEKKAHLLLKEMKSVKKIRAATVEELLAVKGISSADAEAIYEYYHKEKE